MRRLYLLPALLLLLACTHPAQFDAVQIAGFVRDTSESGIAVATVTVRNENTGEERAAKTSSTGYYVFPNLVVGTR